MKTMNNVFLIGPMGSGKTTIGRYLAKELQLDFYDSDLEVEYRTGVPVSWIFDYEGEEGFREREQRVIEDLTQLNHIVLATGGGVILRPENRHALAAHGHVIYLQVSIDQQLKRLSRSQNRPLLKTDDPRKRLQTLIQQRQALYEAIADKTFNTDNYSVPTIALQILEYLRDLR